MLSSSKSAIRILSKTRSSLPSLSHLPSSSSLRSFSLLSSKISSTSSFLIPSSSKSPLIRSSNYATSTTAASSTYDSQEVAAQEHLDIGNAALENEDLTSAARAYEESLRIKDSAIGNYNLGVVRYTEKNLPAAIKAFLHSLTLAPSTPPRPSLSENDDPTPPLTPTQIILADTHTNLGACFIMSDPPRPDLALYHLQEALEINPDDGEVCYNLAAVLEATGEENEALVAYERANKLGIDSQVNIRNLGAKILGKKLKEEEAELASAEKLGGT